MLLVLAFSGLVGMSGYGNAQDYVVEDEGVGLTREELEFIVKYWTPEMQQAAVKDPGDRIELINMALANKKIARKADSFTPDMNPEDYWKLVLSIRNMQSKFVVRNFVNNLDVPDMSALAAERFKTQQEKYAFVPEQRMSSHILLLCSPPACSREKRRPEAEALLAELKSGASFEELATARSEDPRSRKKNGKFDQWLTLGMTEVDPHFVGGVFEIKKVGDYSGIVETKFGFHIIRLDELRPAHYKTYDEVRETIIADLRAEYTKLAAKQFDAGFRMTDEAFIDSAAMDEILAPYRQD
jgi:hypothetical protein